MKRRWQRSHRLPRRKNVDMHCEDGAAVPQWLIRHREIRAEEVAADSRTHREEGRGASDEVAERVQKKSGRKVELLSPLPPPPQPEKKEQEKRSAEEEEARQPNLPLPNCLLGPLQNLCFLLSVLTRIRCNPAASDPCCAQSLPSPKDQEKASEDETSYCPSLLVLNIFFIKETEIKDCIFTSFSLSLMV